MTGRYSNRQGRGRLKLAVGLGVALAALGLLRGLSAPAAAGPGVPVAPAAASSAGQDSRSAPVSSPETLAPAPASNAGPASAPKRLPYELDPEQLAGIEKQWCSHFAQAHDQAVASIRPETPPDPKQLDVQRLTAEADAVNALLTSRAQYQVRARVLERWTERLLAQDDAPSRATAAYLTSTGVFGDYRERRLRLAVFSAEALASRDPYVVELWGLSPFLCHESDGCRRLPALRWAEVEPGNLLAWLPPLGQEAQITERQWTGIEQARYARSYRPALQARLLALLPGTAEGLEFEQVLSIIEEVSGPMNDDRRVMRLQRMCAGQAGDPRLRARCARAAEVLWASPDFDWLARARAAELRASFGPPGEQPWADRMSETRSLVQRALPLLESFARAIGSRPKGCATHAGRLQGLRDRVEQGPAQTLEQDIGRVSSRP